jgi:hypothetical protein
MIFCMQYETGKKCLCAFYFDRFWLRSSCKTNYKNVLFLWPCGPDSSDSIPGKGETFHMPIMSQMTLGLNYPVSIRGCFPMGRAGRGMELTSDHLVPESRMVELYLHSHTCLHCVVLNELGTGTTLLYLGIIRSNLSHCSFIPFCLTIMRYIFQTMEHTTRGRKKIYLGNKTWPVHEADNLTTICELIV